MTTEHDPMLEALFAEAQQPLEDDIFTQQVLQGIDQSRRWRTLSRVGIALVLVICEWLLDTPLQSLLQMLSEAITQSLVEIDSRWLELILTPINSVASIIAVVVLATRALYRKIFA